MARLPRLTVTGLVHHVLLRGNNGQPVFLEAVDRTDCLAILAELAQAAEVQVHAYLLGHDRLHLLLTPLQDGALQRLMQQLGRRYVRRFNLRHARSGTLWEGRYRSTLVDAAQDLLRCMAWLDNAPVETGWSATPAAYPWSSHGHYAGVRLERWLTVPPQVWAMGNTPFAREAAYAERVRQGVSTADSARLWNALMGGWVSGTPAFVAQVQQATGRRVLKGRAGRPPRPVI
jgi:putative transposase